MSDVTALRALNYTLWEILGLSDNIACKESIVKETLDLGCDVMAWQVAGPREGGKVRDVTAQQAAQ